MTEQRITIDPITRLEGHGKIEIFLDEEGDVANTYFQIPELRGFERFCVGRPVEEMPLLTNRICGVCPEAHHMAAAKAADAVYHVDPPRTAKKLRELLYMGFLLSPTTPPTSTRWLARTSSWDRMRRWPSATSWALSTRSAWKLAARSSTRAKYGHTVIEMLGGRKVHPCTSIPGGLTKGITEEQQKEIVEIGQMGRRIRPVQPASSSTTSCSATRHTST